jgi:F420-dependent oxidoreductase-like protein
MQLGFQIWPQNSTWPAMRDVAKLADELDVHSIWTWDHFYALSGAEERPNFEAWQILPACAAVTKRVKLGALVSGITYRHPAVLANMAATLDHVSNGRAICGIGAAWNQTEHRAYGIHLGTPAERSRRFAEGAKIVRALLDGERVAYGGKYYTLADAVLNTRPVQERLPIMIGGGGEQKTLRTTARYADMWHGFGTPEVIARKIEILRGHCANVGRDPAAITIFGGRAVCVREDAAEGKRVLAEVASHHHGMQPQDAIIGGPDEVAERLLAYWNVGVRGFIVGFPYPYDTVTMRRLAEEVLPRLRARVGAAA